MVALVLTAGVVLGAGAAYAYWTSTDSGKPAMAAADSIPRGAAPSVSLNGSTVTATFSTVTTASGRAVTSYLVSRYPSASATTPSATFSCTATGATASCAEPNVPQGVWYYSDTPQLAGSLWTGQESVRSAAVTTDTTAPVITVTAVTPAPNAAGWNRTSSVSVGLSATDAGTGVASITYWVDSGTRTTVPVNPAAPTATASVSVTGQGSHVVSFFATDAVGNVAATLTRAVRIDSVSPVVAGLVVPAYVNLANRAAVPVGGTISETNDSVVTIVASGTSGTPVSKTVAVTGGSTSWSTTMDLSSGVVDGTITYSVTAKDVADNTSAAVTTTSIRDTVAPTVTFAAQPDGLVKRYNYTDNLGSTPDRVSATAGSVGGFGTDTGVTITATQTSPHAGLKYTGPTIPSSGNGSIPAFDVEALGLLNALTVTYKLEAVDAAGNIGPNSVTVSFLAAL